MGRVRLTIDPDSPDAPYEQIRARIAAGARSGEFPVGLRLPTVRGLAADLGLAANTVAKAYRALEADGVIETRGRNGTVVAGSGDAAAREVARAAEGFARLARRLGLDEAATRAAAEGAVRAVWADGEPPRAE
ncbi:GntR family transcriptional regulator [Streptomyces sp. ST2-7A]|uniref:GntR family transcriptional regulator n=1 Tax=Streptomyces sp. ST2-7A TaxID=2907214 RepID=UPI001F3F3AFA|nr:GntR family transcriptional regulator [Streptomyces sp. ST2-7A]MCE7080777.1 GntR family transcriptional regulator [Streptomyces sp. ST2-7A]